MISSEPSTLPTNSIAPLSKMWAKKYVQKLIEPEEWEPNQSARTTIATQLLESLRSVSAKAWTKTEAFLSTEVKRHQINYKLIDPWEISRDIYFIYEKALAAYAEQKTPQQLSVLISTDIGNIRQRYTAIDPRVIGFVSLQFHYSGQLLLKPLSVAQQSRINPYFKVIDDNLYMPLQRSYKAAARHDYDSIQLQVVRKILSENSIITQSIVDRVIELYPRYESYSGTLNQEMIRISSARDVEMFQVYLWVCVLEGNFSAIQQELFPLCLMLYPSLKVNWELVRQMLHLMRHEIMARLNSEQIKLFTPYFQALWEIFSPEVFEGL